MSQLFYQIKQDWKTNRYNFWLDKLFFALYRCGSLLHQSIQKKKSLSKRIILKLVRTLYNILSHSYGCFIPFSAKIGNNVIFEHSFYGIFISQFAEISDNVKVFHHVTIGSNFDSGRKKGAPFIGNNVIIGTGACIIGKIRIGNSVKIGANTTVVKDVPDNATVIGAKSIIILKHEI